ncbi:conserved hypothetical protein [Ricinus communis]|uniref:Uncharacterized protein n=1 Tax=Ricinus communis TaxID=3988 RepID=B9RW56_RICCO|nr:conserved hypothetical protein [Ricinus communis]
MTMKNEQVEGYTEDAPDPQHARAAPLVCALGVKSVGSQIVAARLVSTLPGMLKHESINASNL